MATQRKSKRHKGAPAICPNPHCNFKGHQLQNHLDHNLPCRTFLTNAAVDARLAPGVDTNLVGCFAVPWDDDDDDDDTALVPNLATLNQPDAEPPVVTRRRARIIETGFAAEHCVETKLLKLLSDNNGS